MPFGRRLKEARLSCGMTQEELAAAVGVTKGAIGNYESEVSSPKETILIKLMDVLHVDPNYLYQDFIKASSLSPEETALLSAYRAADPIYQAVALKMLKDNPRKKTITEPSAI